MRVSRETRDAAVDYSLGAIDYICREIGPRESGMPAERKAQEWLKDELLNNGWADEAEIEDFTVSRHGLVGFTKIVSVLLVLAAAMQFIAVFAPAAALACHIVTIVLMAVSLLITVMEFLLYKPFIDPLLPKTTSGNVYARYKSSGETRRRIVFSGHCDSAYEWTLMKIKPPFMIAVIVMCVVGVLVTVDAGRDLGVHPLLCPALFLLHLQSGGAGRQRQPHRRAGVRRRAQMPERERHTL